MMRKVLCTLFLAAAAISVMAKVEEPVRVDGGLVSGVPGWGFGVREYLGIPYAAPPVRDLRWRPPHPVQPWQGVHVADRFSAACMQAAIPVDVGSWNKGLINFSEDCLYLNIWTPASAATDRLPVMVWIHGGGGVAGSSAEPVYDGNATAKRGVVVVSLNYRLGVFGWMAHQELTKESEHRASGNYGSHDQLAALRWVKQNIEQFGGDPDRVTVWGQSGGARSVNFLMASPLFKGLARAAIAQSHTSFGRMMTLSEAEANGVRFAQALGKSSLADLRAMSAGALIDAAIKNPPGMSGAIVDGWLLPKDVYSIYAQGQQADIALLTGATNDEGGNIAPATATATAPAPALPSRNTSAGPAGAAVAAGGRGRGAAPATLDAYLAWVRASFGVSAKGLLELYPAKNDAEVRQAYHDVYRDINFAGHRTWAKLQATTGKAPVYVYMFSHIPSGSAAAGHFSEVAYVFDNLRMRDRQWTDIDRKVAQTMSVYWTNFAKTFDPNGPGLAEWPRYNPNDERWLNFGDAVRLERFNSAGVDLIANVQDERRRGR